MGKGLNKTKVKDRKIKCPICSTPFFGKGKSKRRIMKEDIFIDTETAGLNQETKFGHTIVYICKECDHEWGAKIDRKKNKKNCQINQR